MNELLAVLFIAIGQTAPEPVPGSGVAAFLQTYGGWGVSVILGGVVTILAKAYKSARDSEIETLKVQNKELTELALKSNDAISQLNNTLQSVVQAMQGLDRRLEDVERKLE